MVGSGTSITGTCNPLTTGAGTACTMGSKGSMVDTTGGGMVLMIGAGILGIKKEGLALLFTIFWRTLVVVHPYHYHHCRLHSFERR